ncbi:MAG: hypothetical protein JNJ88_09275 [Planctomycetes bacterium]|nr:hypothetical protein [Planctomycetota bacterium]
MASQLQTAASAEGPDPGGRGDESSASGGSSPSVDDVLELLGRANAGDPESKSRLTELIQQDLHRIAERILRTRPPGFSLQATDLMGEAWLRVFGSRSVKFDTRGQLLEYFSRAMRSALTDYHRRRKAARRGGQWVRVPMDQVLEQMAINQSDLESLEVWLKRLESEKPELARIATMRLLGSMKIEEIAAALKQESTKVRRSYEAAERWLAYHMRGEFTHEE